MSELTTMTAADLSAALRSKDVSATEVTQAHLDRIAEVDGRVHAFLHVAAEEALAAAEQVDSRRAAGAELGPLAGVPVALKDVFTTIDMPTTAGSRILNQWRPPYDATITTRLRRAGAIILGKTNMDEFAMGSSTENSAFGPTRNPWDLSRVPGGSSGGSAASVAAYEAPLAIGTDTGGSIRQPAAVCGITGMKPTYGGNSRYGLIAFASSLDTPGPLARTVLDAALLQEAISGHDPMDATSIDEAAPPVVAAARQADVAGLRIGVVTELSGEGYQPGVLSRFSQAVELLESLGAKVTEVSCPHFRYALPAYYLIAPSECSSNLARFDAMRYGLRVGDDGEAAKRFGMRPARKAARPASTARRIAYAIRTGSRAPAIAVFINTPSQPNSIAIAASDAVPTPASTNTGTLACSIISDRFHGFKMPMPEPISDASGITATQPISSSILAWIGSSLQYTITSKPSLTSVSAAFSVSGMFGNSDLGSPSTSSLTSL